MLNNLPTGTKASSEFRDEQVFSTGNGNMMTKLSTAIISTVYGLIWSIMHHIY